MAQQTLNTPRETTHQRIADALEDMVDKIVDTSSASNIDYDNTTSGLSANKVQSAIDELALAGFVTNTVNNLVNYYLKSETYNKTEVDSLITAVKNSRFEAVSTLPTTNIKTNVIYLVPKSPTQTNNAKDEYINLDGTTSGWEKIGDTEVDLSGYVTTTALNTALSNYTTTANLTNLLNNKVDKVSGKGLSTNDYTTADKNKLTGIEAEANKTVVDSAMSDSSTNPLQNKVITKELEGLLPSLTFMSRERRNITSDLGRLSTAVAEQNLAKYGYKIGDYFTGASGYTYILADYNTFKGISTPYCIASNHLGIVVDTHQTSQWYSGDASSVGYNGSTLHTYLKGTVMDNIKTDFKALFGGSTGLEHLIAHSKLFTTALANWAWQANQYISALTCTQIDAGSQWTANGFQEGEASKSLELFRKYKWTEIFGGEYPWLRDLSNYGTGGSSACHANYLGYLNGDASVTYSLFVVGLINFY